MGIGEKISVIIPTRSNVRPEVLDALSPNVKVLIGVDTGEGQTRIRHKLAKEAETKYILILDDDVVLPETGVKNLLSIIESKNFDAVCGEFRPVALNGFSESVLKFKENPPSFYKTGVTLWDRDKFIELMNEVPLDSHKHVGDLIIGDIIKRKRLKTFKAYDVVAVHLVETTPLEFFKYKYSCGIGIGWYYKKYGGYWSMLLKFLVSIPFSSSRGVLVYRLATFLGMLRYILFGS